MYLEGTKVFFSKRIKHVCALPYLKKKNRKHESIFCFFDIF